MKILITVFLFSFGLFGMPIFHINHLTMFNQNAGNQTGLPLSALEIEFPQDLMIIQGRLVGHLNQNFPGDLVVWTTPKTVLVEREEVSVERFVIPPLPPTIDNPVQPPVVPPHHICYHDCHPEPPGTEIPEPSTATVVLVALLIGALLLMARGKRKKN